MDEWDRFLWEYALRLTTVRRDGRAWAEGEARELALAGDELGARRLLVIARNVGEIEAARARPLD